MEKESGPTEKLTLEHPEIMRLKDEWYTTLREIMERYSLEPENASIHDLEKATLSEIETSKGQHQFVIISAPSGGGKGTIGKSLEAEGVKKLPRYTTRKPRPGEVNGKDYFFITDNQFEKMDRSGEFLPHVETHGKHRATSKKMLKEWVGDEKKFYLEGSTGAYDQIINTPEVQEAKPLSIFLLPPSFEEHFQRLANRPDSISNKEILDRLEKAVEHLKQTLSSKYDGYIVNDDIKRATDLILENI